MMSDDVVVKAQKPIISDKSDNKSARVLGFSGRDWLAVLTFPVEVRGDAREMRQWGRDPSTS
jgi:hypothetical protein